MVRAKIKHSVIYSHVVPNLDDFISSIEHKMRKSKEMCTLQQRHVLSVNKEKNYESHYKK